jgi:hypothetical protein
VEHQPYSIRKILDSVNNGAIRIPTFQRGFVWNSERVAYLMDSIYKNFPFGSLLFWRTKNQLPVERKLGHFELPEPAEDYPIDYVLDGQQRLTAIFTVFQTELAPTTDLEWADIYFDMLAEGDAQDSQFVAIKEAEFDASRFFPLNVLFDSVRYREATSGLTSEQIEIIDRLQEVFKEVSLPVQILKTEDRSIVAIVFERVNRLGMELDTLQLLSAWTWNENFDLLENFKELKEELEDFGFEGVGDDSDLMLKCTAAILQGEPSAETLLKLNGNSVRQQFPSVHNGIKGAIDFLRTNLNVYSLKNLPYPSLLIPLSVFFAEPDGKEVSYNSETYKKIKRWFWKSCFGNRYASQTRKTAIKDIVEMKALKDGKESALDSMTVNIPGDFFSLNVFRMATANSKTLILMLAANAPKSFLSGKDIELDRILQRYNRTEFHHIYPRAFLKENRIDEDKINSLSNFCFLSTAENKKIGRKKPSVYIDEIASGPEREAVLGSAFCNEDDFNDDFDQFIANRSRRLSEFAQALVK